MSHITGKIGDVIGEGEKAKVKSQKSKEEKKEKKPLAAEVGAPIAHAPGNPAKQSAITSGLDNSSQTGGVQNTQADATFIPHRQGSRGE
jgi:hypothetical protein